MTGVVRRTVVWRGPSACFLPGGPGREGCALWRLRRASPAHSRPPASPLFRNPSCPAASPTPDKIWKSCPQSRVDHNTPSHSQKNVFLTPRLRKWRKSLPPSLLVCRWVGFFPRLHSPGSSDRPALPSSSQKPFLEPPGKGAQDQPADAFRWSFSADPGSGSTVWLRECRGQERGSGSRRTRWEEGNKGRGSLVFLESVRESCFERGPSRETDGCTTIVGDVIPGS